MADLQSVAAQRAAMAIVNAYRLRDDVGRDAVTDVLRDACHDHHPTDVMLALASLVVSTATVSDRRHRAGLPAAPDDVLAAVSYAVSATEPG